MKIGSIVKTVTDFSDLKKSWGFDYPNIGDILTVSRIEPHPRNDLANMGIILLNFKEIPNLVQVCDKQVNGEPNFIEISLILNNFCYGKKNN